MLILRPYQATTITAVLDTETRGSSVAARCPTEGNRENRGGCPLVQLTARVVVDPRHCADPSAGCSPLGIGHARALPLPTPTFSDLQFSGCRPVSC